VIIERGLWRIRTDRSTTWPADGILARDRVKAVPYLRQSGEKMAIRSANLEAIVRFEQALSALHRLPRSREVVEQAIDLRFDLRNALLPLGEFARILDVLREAETLVGTLDDHRRRSTVFSLMAFSSLDNGRQSTGCRVS